MLVLQAVTLDPTSPDFVGKLLRNAGTSSLPLNLVNPSGFSGTLLLVNGHSAIEERLPCGAWLRLQIVNALAGSDSSVSLGFTGSSAGRCEIQLLAHVGIPHLSLTGAAVTCNLDSQICNL